MIDVCWKDILQMKSNNSNDKTRFWNLDISVPERAHWRDSVIPAILHRMNCGL